MSCVAQSDRVAGGGHLFDRRGCGIVTGGELADRARRDRAFSVALLAAATAPAATGDGDEPSARIDAPPAAGVTVPPDRQPEGARPTRSAASAIPPPAKPASIGSYSNGCLLGGVALPRPGPGFELMRLGRNRRYGHPALVAYIKRLAAAARKKKVGTLLVGDLGQPRGGPTPTGHRSHQAGSTWTSVSRGRPGSSGAR